MTAIHAAIHHTDSSRDGTVQARINPQAAAPDRFRSRKTLWAGRIMSGAAALFLLFDATFKVLQLPVAVEATAQLGSASVIFRLGLLQLAGLVVYLVPRTSVLGAVLWTGYLGGAVATHVRVGNPLFSNVLFPIYVAALLWGGLWLRDERLRSVLPMRAAKYRATARSTTEDFEPRAERVRRARLRAGADTEMTEQEEPMSIKQVNPYLYFNGTAAKAIQLYENALGAKTESLTHFGDIPGMTVAPEHKTRVIHALVRIGEGVIMISDTQPGMPIATEGNVHVCLDFDEVADMTKKFEALAVDGKVTLPLHDTFWGAKFGMLTDAFGVRWMFNSQLEKA